jgi:hypothetical protein
MQQRQAVVAKAAARYQRSRKKEKSRILSELIELTDYSRAYARRCCGNMVNVSNQGTSVSGGCAAALSTAARAVLRREGESGTDQDLENDGLQTIRPPISYLPSGNARK